MVRQPRGLQRLFEPAAPRADLRPERVGCGLTGHARGREGVGQRLRPLRGIEVKVAAFRNRTVARRLQRLRGGPSILWSRLLQGRLSKAVMERICQQKTGLFPSPRKSHSPVTVRTGPRCANTWRRCSMASARLDKQPELLFRVHGVDRKRAASSTPDAALPLTQKGPASSQESSAARAPFRTVWIGYGSRAAAARTGPVCRRAGQGKAE